MTRPARRWPGVWPLCLARLRGSMTLQIWLAITAMATLLVGGSSAWLMYLTRDELADVGDVILIGQLVALRVDIAEDARPLDLRGAALVRRTQRQLGRLEMAILDAERRPLAVSEPFSVPGWGRWPPNGRRRTGACSAWPWAASRCRRPCPRARPRCWWCWRWTPNRHANWDGAASR